MKRKSSFRSYATVLSLVCALVLGLMPLAGAAPAHKSFTATITPDSAVAGTLTSFDLTVTNTSKNTVLGAVKVTLPDGFTLAGGLLVDLSGWSVDGLVVLADTSQDRLDPGESVVVSFDAVTPLQDGDTDYEFGVDARQANKFNSHGNALNLEGDPPSVEVTGAATRCVGACELSLDELGTSVKVNASCPDEDDCGILVTDLDQVCFLEDCKGESVFWTPPTSSTQEVKIVLKIPGDFSACAEEEESYGYSSSEEDPYEECDPVEFFVAPSGVTTAEECGAEGQDFFCQYEVKYRDDFAKIIAKIDPIDPRGFAS